MKRRIQYALLAIILVLPATVIFILTTNWGLSAVLSMASAMIPGELVVKDASGDLLSPLSLKNIEYRQQGIVVTIEQLDLVWQASALLTGKLHVNHLSAESLNISIQQADALTESKTTSVDTTIVFPFDFVIEQGIIKRIDILIGKESTPVVIGLLDVSAATEHQELNLKHLLVQAYEMQLETSGKIALQQNLPLKLTTDYTYNLNKHQQLTSQGVIEGDLEDLRIIQKTSGLVDAKLDGNVSDIMGDINWKSAIELIKFNTAVINEQVPDTIVTGNIRAAGDLHNISMQADLNMDEKDIGVANLHIDANSNLSDMNYQFALNGSFTGIDFPESQIDANGAGDLTKLVLAKLQITSLQGRIEGDAKIDWSPEFLASANLAVYDLNPGVLSARWPGKLNADLSLRSEFKKGSPRFVFKMEKLDGVLRELPIRAHASGSWYQDGLAIDVFKLNIEQSQFDVRGGLAKEWDLKFSAQSPNINQFLPEAKGKLEVNGQLSGHRAMPQLELTGQASELAYAEESIKSLLLRVDAGLAANAPMNIDIHAQGVTTPVGHWANAILKTAGNNHDHSLLLNLDNDTSKYSAKIQGRFSPWQWQGQLEQVEIDQKDIGMWHLKSPVDFSFSKNDYRIQSLCLLQNSTHICSEVNWAEKQRMVSLDGQGVPLTLLNPWLPANIQMSGQLTLQARLQSGLQDAYDAMLSITSTDKAIAVRFLDLNEEIHLAASEISATLDSKSLQANVKLPMSEGGGVKGEIQLAGWSPVQPWLRSQPVHAHILIDQIPAEAITRFAPDIARAHGYLNADFNAEGTLGAPQLRGKANWLEGNMIIPELGITIHDISANIQSSQINALIFQVKARSGEGEVELTGKTQLDPGHGWPTQVNLNSHNLEVMNTLESYILIDTKVDVAMQGSTININGEITVPRARLRPRTLPEGTVGLSRDVVVISEDQSDTKRTPWLVTTRVQVKLGELVDFDGFGVSGKLRGNLSLIDEPSKLAVGQGEINIVDGIYRLRGQDLKIRRGRLLFANTFIDDPGVDVDAIREIDTVTVGVRLKGTLKQPQLTIFSEPAMSDSDALSYLILGHAASQSTATEGESMQNRAAAMGFVAGDVLSQEIGGRLGLDEMRVDVGDTAEKTALVMGKYLSPKVYVRYFSGIVESSNIVQLRYQLSKRVQIQTEGGYRGSQSVTGGDIFFTIEY